MSYSSIHKWIRKYKTKSEICEICKNKFDIWGKSFLELANLSGEYKKDVNDFIWCHRSCHQKEHFKGNHKDIKFKEFNHERGKNQREIHRKYYENNKKEIKLKENKKYWLNKDNRKQIIKNYYEKNKEHLKDKVRKYRKERGYDKIKSKALRFIREKYNTEFKEILDKLKQEIENYNSIYYKKLFRKAEKILKNNHKEEFLSKMKGG